jgi:tetratricopeptide (TPR) repeat protein
MEEALRIDLQEHGQGWLAIGDDRSGLAIALNGLREFNRAEIEATQACAILRSYLPRSNLGYLVALAALIRSQCGQEKYAAATATGARAVQVMDLIGWVSPEASYLDLLEDYSLALRKLGRTAEAEAIAARAKNLPPDVYLVHKISRRNLKH